MASKNESKKESVKKTTATKATAKKANAKSSAVKKNSKPKSRGKRCLGCMELFEEQFDICPKCGYIEGSEAEEAIHLVPGTILANRYVIGKSIGYGGFGVTYIAWDGKLEQKVAVKEYLPSEFSTRMAGQSQITMYNGEKSEQFKDGLKKFVEEAKRLAKFQSEPGIVTIYDSFEENDTAYIVMEYLEGETLASKLNREKTIPENEAVKMLTPIMETLKVVHAEGIIHRDISPDNIFITKDGEVKLIDFGAARYATTSYSRSLTVVVKPGYSPEEQYRSKGDQGPHTDVFALAATLYKMVTGKTPPDAMERRGKIENGKKDILTEPHILNSEISINRENAILNALNIRIVDRTPDIDTFLKELNSKEPAKRRVATIKKLDFYAWPTWLKVLVPSLLAVFILLGILMATGVIEFKAITNRFSVPDGYARVPNVEKKTVEEANKLIEGEGFIASPIGNVESDYLEPGLVIIQTPDAKKPLKLGGTVEYKVSAGKPEKGEVPYVIFSTEGDAVAKLEALGFTVNV